MARGVVKPNEKDPEHSLMRGVQDAITEAANRGDYDSVLHLARVGNVGPDTPFPSKDIRDQRLFEGREQAQGNALAAISVLPYNLAQARMRARVSQSEAASAAGVSRQTISSYENGTVEPTISTLVLLATLYGTTPDRILGLIDADRARLLDLYEFSTPSNRLMMLKVAELVQSDARSTADSDVEERRAVMRQQYEAWLDKFKASATQEDLDYQDKVFAALHELHDA